MSRRTQAERDAMTVEIGYAFVGGALLGVATFAGILLPALLMDLSNGAERVLFRTGAVLGALAFALRVAHVLWRFPRTAEEGRLPPAQPSRPERTSPDP
ncbi:MULTISPECIES: DUF6332 family protein [Streptomyces]|uniref:DUF6332 family protein n=1 Tax=Streptomyces glycanivorans TaxID=3033808 RepID=A0ABY9JKE4_9ACTN|nr:MULTISPECIES: DUF6332 family protein [unclassified Streptomyces]WSQ81548.1 DUF6332 family protein [Streptomyces sp. NBC_01213]TXS10732.1 hypothetical protein EAO68_28795 [Streptomyces sp. wa22]WLQ68193.1 DUF6332 family protein [Streptomyces sp. Alt3]WSQ88875.1 DUF6332 family protein [Streptomyces sp. NBC_01212]WSR05120.1 DUF6332 family protein [Streptomyces sp. NBC_01208]